MPCSPLNVDTLMPKGSRARCRLDVPVFPSTFFSSPASFRLGCTILSLYKECLFINFSLVLDTFFFLGQLLALAAIMNFAQQNSHHKHEHHSNNHHSHPHHLIPLKHFQPIKRAKGNHVKQSQPHVDAKANAGDGPKGGVKKAQAKEQ